MRRYIVFLLQDFYTEVFFQAFLMRKQHSANCSLIERHIDIRGMLGKSQQDQRDNLPSGLFGKQGVLYGEDYRYSPTAQGLGGTLIAGL